ncbi:MAG: hypothetical protein II987_05270 [Clostridia bacterium]|nr:hypothetical protein [Clostridia bacterium]
MKKITSFCVALVLTLLCVLPVSASHTNPCNGNHSYTGSGTPNTPTGSFSFDPEVQEYWTKSGEIITLAITVNDLNNTLKQVGGIIVSFKLSYDSKAVTFIDPADDSAGYDMLSKLPGGTSDAARKDWEKGTEVTAVKDSRGNDLVNVIAESNVGVTKGKNDYAITGDGQFTIQLKFKINSGWTGDITFKTVTVAITGNNSPIPKEYNGAGFTRNVKSYTQLLANSSLSGDWTVLKEPTCSEKGKAELRCKICGELAGIKDLPVSDHKPGPLVEKVKQTCTQDGVWESKCTGCNKVYETKTEKATGHKAGEFVVKTPATCTKDGVMESKCTVCNTVIETKTIKATGHKAGELKKVKEMTCVQDEVWESRCTECDAVVETKTEKSPGHKYGEWAEHKAPTMVDEGEERRVCSECNEYESRATAKLPFEGLRGDVERTGEIDEEDAAAVKDMFLGDREYDKMDQLFADGNENGKLDLGDYIFVLRQMNK